ncbi:oxepin-CoA hydrolase, alternative type [Hydrogenophaga sp. OTU3427]|uniref:oxepin-CoA hydrolase, alternative type n=1 Tax=Hydrogenophaga sp. OTU3427 TaxID=3043856 RepID=UPI00313C51BE
MAAALKSHSHGATLVLTISNPEHRNALGPDIYSAGIEAFNAADSNPEVRSIVITGEGAHFCAGGQLQRLLDNRQKPPEFQARTIEEGLHSWIEAIRSCSKPVIAAVEGAAAGAGFSLALASDFVVAAENSVFVMAYSSVGLTPDGGGSWSLARQLPRATALKLLMLGERMDAQRLLALGMVNEITAPGGSLDAALALAERLNARAPNVLASIKELVNDARTQTLHEQLGAERDHFVNNLHHANGGEGIAAFLEKRTPQYR